jgi:hypothetical protein
METSNLTPIFNSFFPEAEGSDCQVTEIYSFQNGVFSHKSEAKCSPTLVVVVVLAVVEGEHECH